MQGVTAQRGVEFLDLQLFRLEFLVAGGGVAGRGFTLLAGFRTFDCDDFSGHKLLFLLLGLLFHDLVVFLDFCRTTGIYRAQLADPALPQSSIPL